MTSATQQDGTRRPLVAIGISGSAWRIGCDRVAVHSCNVGVFVPQGRPSAMIRRHGRLRGYPRGMLLAKPAKCWRREASPLSRRRYRSDVKRIWMMAASPRCWSANEVVLSGGGLSTTCLEAREVAGRPHQAALDTNREWSPAQRMAARAASECVTAGPPTQGWMDGWMGWDCYQAGWHGRHSVPKGGNPIEQVDED